MGSLFDGMRTNSFDSVWYWGLVALIWTLSGNRVMGAPLDMVQRMPYDPQAAQEVRVLARVAAHRTDDAVAGHAPLFGGALAFGLTSLILWGFFYGVLFAQALFFLLAPLCIMGVMRVRTAQVFLTTQPKGDTLYQFLMHQRWRKQVIMIAWLIAVSLWGGVQSVLHATFLG